MICTLFHQQTRKTNPHATPADCLAAALAKIRTLRSENWIHRSNAQLWEKLCLEKFDEFVELRDYHGQFQDSLMTAMGPDLVELMKSVSPPTAYIREWLVAGIQYLRARIAELEATCIYSASKSKSKSGVPVASVAMVIPAQQKNELIMEGKHDAD